MKRFKKCSLKVYKEPSVFCSASACESSDVADALISKNITHPLFPTKKSVKKKLKKLF